MSQLAFEFATQGIATYGFSGQITLMQQEQGQMPTFKQL